MPVKTESASNRRQRRRGEAATQDAGVAGRFTPGQKRTMLLCLALAIVTFALYSRAIGFPFIEHYDDEGYVTANPHVQAGLTWSTFVWAWKSTEYANWHPLTWLSHAMDCQLYGLNPAGHHFTNILLHTLSVVLLFLLLVWATGARGRSFLVAALFAVHPFNVESVAWVAERKNVLSMFFFLLTLAAYGWYATKPSLKRYAVVTLLCACALAAKPMAVTLPCVLLLLDFWPLNRMRVRKSDQDGNPESTTQTAGSTDVLAVPRVSLLSLVLEKLPLVALAAGDCVVTIFAQRSYGSMRLILPITVRLENALYAYAMYVWKAFWPARLTVFYPHPRDTLAAWQVGLATVFLLAVSVLVWLERRTRPYLVTGWLWFLGTLVPVIGFIQVGEQAMADRYAYLPLIGIFVMVVWGAADFLDARQVSFRTRAKIAAVVLLLLSAFTWEQIGYWRNADALWSHTVEITKDNFTAESNLGVNLMSSDRAQEAVPHLQEAVRIRPQDPVSHMNLAGALQLSDRPRDAIIQYQQTLQLAPAHDMMAMAYENLGRSYQAIGNYHDARTCYEEAMTLNPGRESIQAALHSLDLSEAIRNVAESPSAAGFLRLGQVLQSSGRLDQARTAFEHALELDPKLKPAQKALNELGAQ